MQDLAAPRQLIEELPAPPLISRQQDARFNGRPLAASVPAAAPPFALALAAQMAQNAATHLLLEAESRNALNAAVNERRCQQQPVFGKDAVTALAIQRYADSPLVLLNSHPWILVMQITSLCPYPTPRDHQNTQDRLRELLLA